jgi:phosphoglycolate phosphatase
LVVCFSPPPSAVVFDLDGTLIDTSRDLATAVNQTRGDLGLGDLELERIKTMVGDGARRLVERALGEADPELLEEAFPKFLAHYRLCCLDTTRPYAGVIELLAELRLLS